MEIANIGHHQAVERDSTLLKTAEFTASEGPYKR
jgi:hypothetical protein